MSKQSAVPARTRLLEAAARLFYARGMSATGIDAITTEAGVAKKSLYNNFTNKNELIAAYIEARHQEWLDLYAVRFSGTVTPEQGVMAVFDAYIDHASAAYEHGFRGCGLLNAAAELPAGSPGRDAVRRHKEQVQSILHDHLIQAGHEAGAPALALHLSFLLEGAMSRAGLEGDTVLLTSARNIATTLMGTR